MSSGNIFACPSCGPPLAAPGDKTEIKCSYCGAMVIVPEALRPKPVPVPAQTPAIRPFTPQPEVIIVERPPIYNRYDRPYNQPYARPVVVPQSGGLGCVGTLIAVMLIFAMLGGLLFAYRPGLFLGFLSHIPRIGAAVGGPQIRAFSVTPNVVTGGGSVVVQWSTNADTVRIDRLTSRDVQTFAALPASGTQTLTVPADVTEVSFQLTASKDGLQQTARSTVRVTGR